ncbi:MAG: hypothetical protein Q9220_000811 [cf. Caloplaca sp. 1 TL-2023]
MPALDARRRSHANPEGFYNEAVSARQSTLRQNHQGASRASPKLPDFLKNYVPTRLQDRGNSRGNLRPPVPVRDILAAATVLHKTTRGAHSSAHSSSRKNDITTQESGQSSWEKGLIRVTDEFAIDPTLLPFDIKDHETWHPYSDLAAWLDTPVKIGTWDSSNQWTRKAIDQDSYTINLGQEKPPNDMKIYISRQGSKKVGEQHLGHQPSTPKIQQFPYLPPHKRAEVNQPNSSAIEEVKSESAEIHPSSKPSPEPSNHADHNAATLNLNPSRLSDASLPRPPPSTSPNLHRPDAHQPGPSNLTYAAVASKRLPLADGLISVRINTRASAHRTLSTSSPPRSVKPTIELLVTKAEVFLSRLQSSSPKTAKASVPFGDTSATASTTMSPHGAQKSHESIMEEKSHKQTSSDVQLGKSGVASAVTDEVLAGITAKSLGPKEPLKPSISIQSVRGRGDERLSVITGDLCFSDAFQGRDASEASEIVFQGRKVKKALFPRIYGVKEGGGNQDWETSKIEYESNQLQGWDGKWQPAPIEWDSRDQYDYSKPEHQNVIKDFIIDRYRAFKRDLCPALEILEDEDFREGHSLAVGLSHFASPIDSKEHHHIAPEDPFSLMKSQNNAALSLKNYWRVHKIAEKQEEETRRRESKMMRKKMTKEERLAEKVAAQHEKEEEIRNLPPNPFKPKLNIFIRPARVRDLAQIRDIHNYYVRSSAVTAERIELTEIEWRSRHDDCDTEKYPFIVAVSRRHGRMEKIVGFAYAEDFAGELTMWRYTCELRVYVDPLHLHQGVGKNLMDCILRGTNPNYRYKQAVEFVLDPLETTRHEFGGERTVRNIVFPIPYGADEEPQAQWIGGWVERIFGFELQGVLKKIGCKERDDNP